MLASVQTNMEIIEKYIITIYDPESPLLLVYPIEMELGTTDL